MILFFKFNNNNNNDDDDVFLIILFIILITIKIIILSSSRKQQGDSEHQMPRHQAGPFKVTKSTSPEDLKLINYIFYSSLDERLDFLPSSKLLYVFFLFK